MKKIQIYITSLPSFLKASVATAVLVFLSEGCSTPSNIFSPYVVDPSWPPDGMQFDEVSWIDVDQQENRTYVLQRDISPIVTIWDSNGQQVGAWRTQELGNPHSITVQHTALPDESIIWITDMAPPRPAGIGYGHCLKRFTLSGEYLGSIGTCAADSMGTGLDPVQFDQVTDIAFDSSGNLFVTDGDVNGLNNRLLKLTPEGEVLFDWSAPDNKPGAGPLEFDLPHAVRIDSCERVWVADARNHRIQVMSVEGEFYGEYACFGGDGVFGIDFKKANGDSNQLFVASSPTTGGGEGLVSIFNVPMICSEPKNIGRCEAVTQWPIPLPSSEETALLHSIAVNAQGTAVYLAKLGGRLLPQKWIKSMIPDKGEK